MKKVFAFLAVALIACLTLLPNPVLVSADIYQNGVDIAWMSDSGDVYQNGVEVRR